MTWTQPMQPRRLRSLALCTLILAAISILTSFPAAAAYRPPDMKKKIFSTKDIKLNKFDRAGLVGALVSIARDFNEKDHDIKFDTRSYALAIAGRLDEDSKKVKDTLEQLKSSGEAIPDEKVQKKRTANRLYSGIRALMRKKGNEANQTCAAYCLNIALTFNPDGDNVDKLKKMEEKLKAAGFKANWKGILKSAIHHNNHPFYGRRNQFAKVEREMPGGSAEEFARKQSRIIGLSVRQLRSGKHAGAANAVIVTALEDEEQDDLLFKFDQKVGTMMAGSLEDVIKLMRVRHNKKLIPKGYIIDITLGDKQGLIDGPSAGTAFALVIDSLFTGEEIDPAYSTTGTMSQDGESGVIGGVAGKIRGAINKDCKIVGIPYGNAKGVWDSFLLDGVETLLKINVFTQKNFDDAYKLSRKNKSASIITAMENYQIVADHVEDKGRDVLKDPSIKKRLQAILNAAPNHLCAKVLLDWSNGKHVKTLSLRGSFDEIDTELSVFGYGVTKESIDPAKEAVTKLKNIQDLIDERVKPYFDASLTLCRAIAEGSNEGEEDEDYSKRMRNLFKKANNARSKLMGDPKIVEEMTAG